MRFESQKTFVALAFRIDLKEFLRVANHRSIGILTAKSLKPRFVWINMVLNIKGGVLKKKDRALPRTRH